MLEMDALAKIGVAKTKKEKSCFIAEIKSRASEHWWFAPFYHLFGWVPLSMMSPESQSLWMLLRNRGYRPFIKWEMIDLCGYQEMPCLWARI